MIEAGQLHLILLDVLLIHLGRGEELTFWVSLRSCYGHAAQRLKTSLFVAGGCSQDRVAFDALAGRPCRVFHWDSWR